MSACSIAPVGPALNFPALGAVIVQVGKGDKTIEFSLDWFFTDVEPQEQVYDIAARDRVQSVLNGYNSTIMAYGQTGSGKTVRTGHPPARSQCRSRCAADRAAFARRRRSIR